MKSLAVSRICFRQTPGVPNLIQFQVFVLLASALVALGQDDGKYRPTEAVTPTTVIPRIFPTTTRVPVYRYNEPRSDPRYGWNSGRWNERYDPRYDVTPRFDGRGKKVMRLILRSVISSA